MAMDEQGCRIIEIQDLNTALSEGVAFNVLSISEFTYLSVSVGSLCGIGIHGAHS